MRPQVAIAWQFSPAWRLGKQIQCSEFKSESSRNLQGCREGSVS